MRLIQSQFWIDSFYLRGLLFATDCGHYDYITFFVRLILTLIWDYSPGRLISAHIPRLERGRWVICATSTDSAHPLQRLFGIKMYLAINIPHFIGGGSVDSGGALVFQINFLSLFIDLTLVIYQATLSIFAYSPDKL